MISILRYLVLGVLLVGVFGCGQQEAAEVQVAHACGIDGLYARFDEVTTLTIALPDADVEARTKFELDYVKDEHASIDFADDFDPTSERQVSVLPSQEAYKTDLSVLFTLDPSLPEQEKNAVLAAPGKMRFLISFTTKDGASDECIVDVGLLPPR